MPSSILDTFSAVTSITITLATLAASTTGVGRQSTIIDNTTNRYQDLIVYLKIKLGTSPSANQSVYIYLIRDDGVSNVRTDGAGATDAAWTAKNAELIGVLNTGQSPATGDIIQDGFLVRRPGPKWGIGVVNNTGVALATGAGSHLAEFVGLNPQSQ